ncbi:MAG TPA: pyridoxal 5'-phosphate synthase glutaminase subunit PdxT [Armatimonadota bacterium]|nr:pyridoxal 5'-phosphate synthase glutaminase subunit PdxT [Armatimonadota bacterium]HOM82892.1 pyridoxal 5'-phosphate synthase glutaminase subunit PdxT [Armatimonadota bacterium]HPO73667.1 pyridoxal 5'-phosphate synthase glutaminase subunit PdxT [Armatimonadota bacterium]HPT97424.1 pyridoxal 5'-phosphate synthase glutaminase subunit PdxT [Armatimonadota bacterium]
MRIGVLALQGNFREHLAMLAHCGVQGSEVRTVEELAATDGLIIPGGESTTVGKLMARYGLDAAIRERVARGMPVFGTCMGLILIAREIEGSDQPCLGLMDVTVRRNAFGRQVDSFECDLEVAGFAPPPVRAVFIRAPYITRVGENVEVLATFEGRVVLARQKNILGAAFHPELTSDRRIHQFFLDLIAGSR